ncbi:MAG: electron transport complex subunit RsxC [candidate division KSB1 bacterium]|nr:electron transport complex subunit RsxC [candidate division KSB1 bacterium]MDZ7346883.1 electron transport complex subunit RsxC [candidate division KSB1 bacterium]
MSRNTFPGGIHPPECKHLTERLPIEPCPSPPFVVIPVVQHIGAPARPIVEKGAQVRLGEPVCESGGFVSVPCHASVSGTVEAVENRPHPSGTPVLSVVIANDGQNTPYADFSLEKDYLELDVKEIRRRIQAAGIVGLGGAAFPTHVKLSPPADKKIDTLILNGAECEPFLTADHRLMLEQTEKILRGMQIMMKVTGAATGIIGIESNKKDAAAALRKKAAELNLPYRIVTLPVKYPQGAEKQLIKALVDRRVPAGGLPMDIGCVVQNVGTAVAVYEAVAMNRPLTARVVTVTGSGVRQPKNLLVPLGTPFSFLLEQCGGLTEDAAKVIMGGPMMGIAQSSLEAPVIKGTSGVLVLTAKEAAPRRESTCISCAHCIDVCPMGLMPKVLGQLVRHERWETVKEYNVLDCIECGSCAFVCPAHINLVHLIKYGKFRVIQQQKKAS